MQPEDRVKAFIADFHRSHTELKKHPDDHQQFDRWDVLVAALDEAHFIDEGGRELANSIGGSPDHTLEREPIVSTRRAGDRVFVETCIDEGLTTYYEYELREVGAGDWRIVQLREFLDEADELFLSEDDQAEFGNPKLRPLRPLPPEEAGFDGTELFRAGRSVKLEKKKDSIEVRAVGTLNVSTGTLVVGDLAYDASTLGPVGQRVPPGNYPAEVATAFGRNAALRVRFSEQQVVKWHPADLGADRGHVIGVDAGNAGILDVSALQTLNARDKQRKFDAYTYAAGRPRSLMLSLVGTNDAVVVDSGWGDGGYPVYWGIDASGKPAVLLVDFRLLADE
jgi:hypothetical protein